MGGGRAVIFLDPASKAALAGASILDVDPAEGRSDMPELLAHYGLSLPDTIAADRDYALPIRVDAGEGRSVVVNQPLFFAVPPENMDREAGSTADLARPINLGAPGHFDRLPVEGLTHTALLATGPDAATLPVTLAEDGVSPMEVLEAYQPQGRLTLAYRVDGPARSLFDARITPDIPDDPVYGEIVRAQIANPPPHLSESDGPVKLIFVADTDLLDDGFYIDPSSGEAVADNGAFVLNAVETLAGEIDLNALRARAPALRPMRRVEMLREAAQAAFFEEQSRLEARLREAESRIEELRLSGAGSDFLDQSGLADLSPAEQVELEQLRAEILDTRARLREIEGDFRRDIDALESRLRLINIWTMPLLVIFAWLGLIAWRRRQV
jgi:ABC-2 type transport system permease protein